MRNVIVKLEMEQTHPGSLRFELFDLVQIEAIPDLAKKLPRDLGSIYDGSKNITSTVITVDAGNTA
jgi:hypothetical protein